VHAEFNLLDVLRELIVKEKSSDKVSQTVSARVDTLQRAIDVINSNTKGIGTYLIYRGGGSAKMREAGALAATHN